MNEIRTPRTARPMPDNIEDWSPECEDLLADWSEIATCYAWLHNYSQRKYKKKYHGLQVPIIVLSTLTGVSSFATEGYIPDSFKQTFTACVGSLNIFAGILGTLLSFLRYSEIYESHRIASLGWSKLSRTIEIELSLHDGKRKKCTDFLKVSRAEYDNLLESSPIIDMDIIDTFNKKFEGKYENVSRPLICNGLKEVKPYYSDKKPPKKKPKEIPINTETNEEEPNLIYPDDKISITISASETEEKDELILPHSETNEAEPEAEPEPETNVQPL